MVKLQLEDLSLNEMTSEETILVDGGNWYVIGSIALGYVGGALYDFTTGMQEAYKDYKNGEWRQTK